jgi:hypothetical protein
LQAVERLQAKLKDRGEVPTEEKLSLLKSVLQSPLFHQILALQKSVQLLKDQVGKIRFFLGVGMFITNFDEQYQIYSAFRKYSHPLTFSIFCCITA